jgi:hypothetical protein
MLEVDDCQTCTATLKKRGKDNQGWYAYCFCALSEFDGYSRKGKVKIVLFVFTY